MTSISIFQTVNSLSQSTRLKTNLNYNIIVANNVLDSIICDREKGIDCFEKLYNAIQTNV